MRAQLVIGNTRPPPLIPASLLAKDARNVLVIYLVSALTWANTDASFAPSALLKKRLIFRAYLCLLRIFTLTCWSSMRSTRACGSA